MELTRIRSSEPAKRRNRSPETRDPISHQLGVDAPGNAALLALMRRGLVRPKRPVSRPGDASEQEADRMAEAVLSGPASTLQEPCACGGAGACSCGGGVQRKSRDAASVSELDGEMAAAVGVGGRPLDTSTRDFFEQGFGQDLSSVRLHDDPRASVAARLLHADAFTVGGHIVLGRAGSSPSGDRRLLAHELAHVVQEGRGADPRIRRQASPEDAPTVGSGGAFEVHVIDVAEYEETTGLPADILPEGQFVATEQAMLDKDAFAGKPWLAGASAAMVTPKAPTCPLPSNTTGILWEGSHLSDLSVVEGDITARGFRAGLARHAASEFERSRLGRVFWGRGAGPSTASLNRGVPGSWANDWMFPYSRNATAVVRTDVSAEQARAFMERLQGVGPEYEGQTYRFSPPAPEHPAFAKAFGADPTFCPPGATNCITLGEHTEALGGDYLQIGPEGEALDVRTGVPGSEPGMAKNMDPYLEQPDEWFTERGLQRIRIGPTMQTRAFAGVVKNGGRILLVYSLWESYKRIEEAGPDERRIVIMEEAGGFAGGFIGTELSAAFGGAVVCAETGPGAFFCAFGFAALGGIAGAFLGRDWARKTAEGFDMLARHPHEAARAAVPFLTEGERQRYWKTTRDMCELDKGEPCDELEILTY